MFSTKRSSKVRAVPLLLALLVAAPVAGAQTIDVKPQAKEQVLQRVSRMLEEHAYVPGMDFNQWKTFLEANKTKVDAAKDDESFVRAVNEGLRRFGASHIVLMPPRDAERRRTGSTVGIGIQSQPTEEGLVIVRVIKGASADLAGFKPGDIVLEVDGKKVEGIRGIPGPEGTKVKLKVKHKADGKIREHTLERKKFSTIRPEELEWVDPKTAKLNIYSFDFNYSQANVNKLMEQAMKAQNIILDLRDNGGGAVINLQHLMGFFLEEEQPLGVFIDRAMVREYERATKGDPKDLGAIARWTSLKVKPFAREKRFKGRVAVLINGGSGSASEIAAAALRENLNANVVGTRSAGAVLVSVIMPASNGFMLQYPIMDYVTAKGVRLEGAGVTPDVVAKEPELRLPGTPDEAVAKAIALFAMRGNDGKTSTKPSNSGVPNQKVGH